MNVREKLIEILEKSFEKQYEKRGLLTAPHTVKDLIDNGVTVQKWIPVTERLPENIANRVLVVCERSNGVFYAHYEKPFWINLETDKPFISTVTHWMPLPELPKGE